MKINEVETLVGMTKKNIRFYEEEGLLSPPSNSENGYRDYSDAEVETLHRIKLLRKLGLPLSEIRKMETGQQTVGDGMRRHLVLLEREKRNLEEPIRLCDLLKEREIPLGDLDAQAVLAEMEHLEQAGTTCQDKQQDIRVRYAAPVIAAAVMVGLMAAVIGVFVWGYPTEGSDAPPVWFMTLVALFPLLVIVGVLLAMVQRLREIRKGEMDDAKKY